MTELEKKQQHLAMGWFEDRMKQRYSYGKSSDSDFLKIRIQFIVTLQMTITNSYTLDPGSRLQKWP